MKERSAGTGAWLPPPWDLVQRERGKKGKQRERLGRRVSRAERAGIGCLLGATG